MSEIVQYKNLIGGEVKAAASGGLLDTVNPATGEVWAKIPLSDRADANEAVAAAKAAFPAWSALSPDTRTEYLKRVAHMFLEYGDELAELESRDNGNPLSISKMVCGPGMEALWSRLAQQTVEASRGRTVPLDPTTLGFTLREPYGVIAAIVPFNMPLGMVSSKVATALAAGNTVVVKPPDQASVSALRFAELVNEILPPGTVNVVSGLGDVGDAMVRNPDVAKVTMTGSSPTAKLIQAAGAETLTPAIFELGGKSPNIVLDDADLDYTIPGLTLASIYGFNAGQACVAGSPDPRATYDLRRGPWTVSRRVAKSIVVGDPTAARHFDGPHHLAEASTTRSWGTSRTASGKPSSSSAVATGQSWCPTGPASYWVEPTLFLAKDNSPRICREEIFGPVGAIIPFDTDDEAIALANDSRFGLASGVWSRDLTRIHRYIREIESGNVWANTYLQTRHEIPFAGIKESGYGHDDVLDFSREKGAVIALPWAADGGATSTIFSQLD